MKRLRVGVLFGGRSAEHEVSLRSAASVIEAMDRSKYDIVPVKIHKNGRWEVPAAGAHPFLNGLCGDEAKRVSLLADPASPDLIVFEPESGVWRASDSPGRLDVVFPVLHGTYGEDGTVQGLVELAGIPCVGAGSAASAMGMDKAMTKAVLRQGGLPVVDYLVVDAATWRRSPRELLARIESELSYPVFVKPAKLGSSVGVSKVKTRDAVGSALRLALSYDSKAIVERGVEAREFEVSVLGNDEPRASLPGEVVPSREFYDYRAKYIDDDSELLIPAPLSRQKTEEVQELARAAFRCLDVAGMARVDFLMDRSTEALLVNELNTIPGFTSISMYPKLWEATRLPMPRLIDRLIELALEKAQNEAQLNRDYPEACSPPT